MKNFRSGSAVMALVLSIGSGSLARAGDVQQAPFAQKTFASPEQALAALRAAVAVHDKAALRDIFGPEIRTMLTGDEAQDRANSRRFAAAIDEGVKAVPESDSRVVLEIGRNKWPFPIPLVKTDAAWRFDTEAGKQEIVDRHVGKDELRAIALCRAYKGGARPKPSHGYLFRTLPTQDGAVPRGFALAAYPEHWGRSGIMTFIIDQDGKLYQRDLGAKTSEAAAALPGYAPDGGWTAVKEPGVSEN